MDIYIEKHYPNVPVGEINPCSIYDLSGPSYVHLNKTYRDELGLTDYDQFFDTIADAYEWLCGVIPRACVMGYVYDWNDGHCKTIHDLVDMAA